MAKKVGFIGLGIMGSGMAEQLLEKGFEVVAWNRSADKATRLVQRGARLAPSPAALAAQVDVVITMVRDDAAVREVLLGERGALSRARPGTTFVNMSTTTPGLAVELERTLASSGHAFLDAPVTGSKAAAASGQLGILVSGDTRHLEAQRDVLTAMGPNVRHVGPIGSSASLKLANNAVAATLMAILGEALALAEASGLSREELVETLVTTVTRVCALKKAKIGQRDYSTDFSLDLMCKDLDQALETARQSNVSMPLVAAVRDVHARARALGNGAHDCSIVADRGRRGPPAEAVR